MYHDKKITPLNLEFFDSESIFSYMKIKDFFMYNHKNKTEPIITHLAHKSMSNDKVKCTLQKKAQELQH